MLSRAAKNVMLSGNTLPSECTRISPDYVEQVSLMPLLDELSKLSRADEEPRDRSSLDTCKISAQFESSAGTQLSVQFTL